MSEMDVAKRIMLRASELGHTLFRCNVGMGWTGKSVCRKEKDGTLTVVIKDARPLRAGLCVGNGDLIGWSNSGKFLAVECKDKGQPTKEQINFIEQVNRSGGIAGIARSPEDLESILMKHGE